jgi:hypothetical protein
LAGWLYFLNTLSWFSLHHSSACCSANLLLLIGKQNNQEKTNGHQLKLFLEANSVSAQNENHQAFWSYAMCYISGRCWFLLDLCSERKMACSRVPEPDTLEHLSAISKLDERHIHPRFKLLNQLHFSMGTTELRC